MGNNNWNVSEPIDHTLIRALPQEVRDVKSSTKHIVAKEHAEPSTSGAGGQHLQGSVRVYLSSTAPTTDPEANNLATSDTSDNGRIAVLTGSSNLVKVYAQTTAGISTGWQAVSVSRVYASEAIDFKGFNAANVGTGTQSGQVVHVGQIDTTYIYIHEPATGAAVRTKWPYLGVSTGIATSGTSILVDMTPNTYAGEESVTLPNGLILKFGIGVTSSYSAHIEFDAAFPTAILSITITPIDSTAEDRAMVVDDDPAAAVGGFYAKSFPVSAQDFYWLAIGY